MDSAARLREQKYQRSVATLSDEESWALARRLAEGEPGCCDALMARFGSPPPAMEFFLSAWWRIGLLLMCDGKVVRLLVGMERAPRQPEP